MLVIKSIRKASYFPYVKIKCFPVASKVSLLLFQSLFEDTTKTQYRVQSKYQPLALAFSA